VNLVQILSAVPEIFHTEAKTTIDMRQEQNRPFRSSLRAVIKPRDRGEPGSCVRMECEMDNLAKSVARLRTCDFAPDEVSSKELIE